MTGDRLRRHAAGTVAVTALLLATVATIGTAPVAATVPADGGVLPADAVPQEAPEALCRASDNGRKENRNSREVWGPTEMNAQIGNQELLISTNQMGSITVFKYPNPSYADQVKHHAFDRRDPYYDSDPNAGAFIGLIVDKGGTQEFTWIRDWGPVTTSDPGFGDNHTQSYPSNYSDTVKLETANERLGLNVTILSAIPKDTDVLIRDISVTAQPGSPVTDVEVVSYANFNLVADKDSLAPTQDWCSEDENQETAEYNASLDAIVHHTPSGTDDGDEFDVGTAVAFDGQSTQHQIAGDDYIGDSASNDPYVLLSNGDVTLPGSDSFTGQTSEALTRDLDFADGQGSARLYFAAASHEDPDNAAIVRDRLATTIRDARNLSLATVRQEKEQWFEDYVGDAPLPNTSNENVTAVSRRALISIAQIWDGETENEHGYSGNIVASIATQAPYGADWIRDGAYFNYVIDRYFGQSGTGKHDWVNQHNRWYMSLQQNPGGPCPQHCHNVNDDYPPNWMISLIGQVKLVPEGGWAMNYYADGQPAGPIGGEIDETAYGAWTLWDHYAVTGNQSYLQRIYPAIKLVGDRLTYDCVDNSTGLQCPRPEDDNVQNEQTIIGGASAHAGLMAATKAASEMYAITGNTQYRDQARAYGERRDELGQAIDRYYWNESGGGFYGQRSGFPSPRAGMPAFLRPFDDPRMQSHMETMWDNINATFQNQKDQGQYEAKGLIGIGLATRRADPADRPVSIQEIRDGLAWIADEHAQPETHIMGEAWLRETYADDEVVSAVSQPHVWEQSLFYLSSLIAYGNGPQQRLGNDVYEEWNRHDATVTDVRPEGGLYTGGDTVTVNATVRNDANVSQDYFVRLNVTGPNGRTYAGGTTTVGPLASGATTDVSLDWTVSSNTGSHDVNVTVWKAVGDPATEPTALASAQYRHTALDDVGEPGAFDVVISKGVLGEAGTVTVSADDNSAGGGGDVGSYEWIGFKNSYDDPVVVAKPAGYAGADPAHVRIRNVSSDGFYVQIEEWDYQAGDGGHATEDVSYVAMEAGQWTLTDGTRVQAGRTSVDGNNWQTVTLDQSFGTAPVVMGVVSSETGWGGSGDIMESKVVRLRNVGTGSFDAQYQLQQGGENTGCALGCGDLPQETMDYIAIVPTTGQNGPSNTPIEVGRTGNTVTDAWHTQSFSQSFSSAPAFVADMQTFDGSDPAGVRRRSVTANSADVQIDEETSGDAETSHTDEDVGYMAVGTGGVPTDIYGDINEGLIAEFGSVTVNAVDMNTGGTGPYQTVNLAGQYDDPVVVAKPMSDDVADYAHIRTRNLQAQSFEIQIEPWDYLQDGSPSGTYAPEDVYYIVMEAGHHSLPDGTEVEAGKFSTGQNWNQPNGGSGFSQSFPTTPVVVTTVNSESGNGGTNDIYEGKVTRNRNVGTGGFETRLQLQEGGENIGCAWGCGGIPAETTSYVAFEPGSGTNVDTPYEVGFNDDAVTDAVDSQSFGQSFDGAPALVADMQGFNGGDTASLRLTSLSASSYGTYVEEEQSGDDETAHGAAEDVGYIAWGGEGGLFDEANEPPTAAATHTPDVPNEGEAMRFDASGSVDNDGVITSYDWDVDGDGLDDYVTQSSTVNHTYDAGGFYDTQLTVTDGDGGVDSESQSLYVNWLPDVLWQTGAPTSEMNIGETLSFNATASVDVDGAVEYYRWDFDGDGAVDTNTTNATATHAYSYPAEYSAEWNFSAELELVDDVGATNATSRNVTVKPGCQAAIANQISEDWTVSLFEVQNAVNWWQTQDTIPDCDEMATLTRTQTAVNNWKTQQSTK